jgi:peroxiredoxin
MPVLSNGDSFPHLLFNAAGGGTIELPDALAGSFGVVLIYRGSWCPYCNAQLAAFSRAEGSLAALGIKVVALSVDNEPEATAVVRKHRLNFPVGYGVDAAAIAAATGAYVNDVPPYLQSTGFVLDAAGRVLTAVYSSGAIGRLVPDDVAGFVRYVRSHAA